jgi:hypothetical protein
MHKRSFISLLSSSTAFRNLNNNSISLPNSNHNVSSTNTTTSKVNPVEKDPKAPPMESEMLTHLVKIKPLPFYDLLDVLMPPSPLIAAITSKKTEQRKKFNINLTEKQIGDIDVNRVRDKNNKIEYIVQVQLRLCLLDVTSEQDDNYPLNFTINVNNNECTLPVSISM